MWANSVSTCLQDPFEHEPQSLGLAEAAVAVLGEGRVLRHRILGAQVTEPAIDQVQLDLFAQPAFGADAEAITNDQHADHQLGIDHRTAFFNRTGRKRTLG
jgi:hypothetical protein